MQTGSVPTFGVTGELHDGAAGLVTLRARWYTSRHGTLTSVDPFDGFAEQPYSQHPYQYAYANPVVWTDPSGQVVDDGDGGGRGRCIPIVERWDPFLQACVPNLGPPPPNNRLTNDAARSYAQAFDDLVGAPAADAGGILTTEIAIPYPGIGGFPRVGLPRIGLTPAQQRAALPAALAALGCPLLTGDQADVRTQPRKPPTSFVADSNIFMDRVEGGPKQRQWIDNTILRNPQVRLFVPASAIREVLANDPYGTQKARLTGYRGGATILPTTDGNLSRSFIPGNTSPVDVLGLQSKAFNEVDMKIVRRAQELNLPLLTTNDRLYNQIFASGIPQRKGEFGSVIIVEPLR